MYNLAIGLVAAVVTALLLRPILPNFLARTIAAGAAAVVAGQISLVWLAHNPPILPNATAMILQALGALAFGAIGAGVGMFAGPAPPARDASDASPVWGKTAAIVALVALAGPFAYMDHLVSVPLATLDPLSSLALLLLVLGWLVSLRAAGRSLAIGLGCIICCLTCLPIAGPVPRLYGQSILFLTAWPLALAGLALLASSCLDGSRRLREQGCRPAMRWLRLTAPAVVSLGIFAAGIVVVISRSETSRAAMHPSVRAAIGDWADLQWREVEPERAQRLERQISNRIAGSPGWWNAALPGLLRDADPAIRSAALCASMPGNGRPTPRPDGLLPLLQDPEPRIRAQALEVALTHQEPLPDSVDLVPAFRSALTTDADIRLRDACQLLGRERLARIGAELVVSASGQELPAILAMVSSADGELFEPVLAILAADPVPERRLRCLELFQRLPFGPENTKGRAPVLKLVLNLVDQPEPIGSRSAAVLLREEMSLRPPVETALRAALLLIDSGTKGPGNSIHRFREADAPVRTAAIEAGLQDRDGRVVDGALRLLHEDPHGSGPCPSDLRTLLEKVIRAGAPPEQAARAILLAAQEKAFPRDIEHIQDPAIRALAEVFRPQAATPGSDTSLIARIAPLLWHDDHALRAQAMHLISLTVQDPAKALEAMEAVDQPDLRRIAQDQRQDLERLAKEQAEMVRMALQGSRGDRYRAIPKLTDQTILARIATEDGEPDFRALAASRLEDRALLLRIALQDRDPQVRSAASGRLEDPADLLHVALEGDDGIAPGAAAKLTRGKTPDQDTLVRIATEAKSPRARSEALSRLTDQAVLTQAASGDKDASCRARATARIVDQALLARIAVADLDRSVRMAAVMRLDDQTALATVALKDGNEYIRRQAVSRMKDQALIASVLVGGPDLQVRQAAFALLDQEHLTALATDTKDQAILLATQVRLKRSTWEELLAEPRQNPLATILCALALAPEPAPAAPPVIAACTQLLEQEQALAACVPEMCELLDRFGDKGLAEAFARNPRSELAAAGKRWTGSPSPRRRKAEGR